ncbi:MAG: DUF3800 domain-containing protein [Colwellia sp.]
MLNIYIDESGSFVPAVSRDSWSLSAALVISNPDERKCKEALRRLKVKCGATHDEEIKLKHVSEIDYLQFLMELCKTGCTLYSVATDGGAHTTGDIEHHRNRQAEKVEEHKDKMLHPEGVGLLEKLANQVRELSPQLHVQFLCQIELIADVVSRSILYYVQRTPSQLNGFRWRIDEKTAGKSNFEKTFRMLIPPLLQSKSLEKPNIHVTDFDYSAMKDFFYTKENAPTYMKDIFDIESKVEGGLNLGKLVWDDFEFVDSKQEIGVQIVDLLASGLRRTLRGGFSESKAISKALGSLMVQSIDHGYPLHFITVSQTESFPGGSANEASKLFKLTQKKILK